MTLSEYLAQDGITASDLAKAAETSVSTITRAAKGELKPGHDLMRKLFEATGGAVTPNDFVGVAA